MLCLVMLRQRSGGLWFGPLLGFNNCDSASGACFVALT